MALRISQKFAVVFLSGPTKTLFFYFCKNIFEKSINFHYKFFQRSKTLQLRDWSGWNQWTSKNLLFWFWALPKIQREGWLQKTSEKKRKTSGYLPFHAFECSLQNGNVAKMWSGDSDVSTNWTHKWESALACFWRSWLDSEVQGAGENWKWNESFDGRMPQGVCEMFKIHWQFGVSCGSI